MAKEDLTIIFARTKRNIEGAVEVARKQGNLPAYLLVGIIDGISADLRKEAMLELSTSFDIYSMQKESENEKKEEQHNASDES